MTPPQTRVELARGLGVADSRMQRSSGHGAGWKEMTEDGGHQQRAGGRSAGRRSLAVGVFTAQEEGFDFGDVPWRRKKRPLNAEARSKIVSRMFFLQF